MLSKEICENNFKNVPKNGLLGEGGEPQGELLQPEDRALQDDAPGRGEILSG